MAWFRRKDGDGSGGKKIVIAEGLWIKCDSCKEIVYRAEVERAGHVCPKCRYAFRIGMQEGILSLMQMAKTAAALGRLWRAGLG